jgi:pyroglutamyl-peptidase
MSTILLTGFEPFGGHEINPSALLAEMLDGEIIGGRRIAGVVLPVSAARVPDAFALAIDRHHPETILSLGLANGRTGLSAERVAINVLDFELADNDAYTAGGEPVIPDGPDAYLATLPVKAITSAWQDAGIPGGISNTAGTYICNQVMYLALHARRPGPAGFIHVPFVPEQAAGTRNTPSMSLDLMLRGVCLALETTVDLLETASERTVELKR